MSDTLQQIYERHCVTGPDVGHGDKGGTHSYIGVYEHLLAPYRDGCTFMEIGLAMGLSLAMWREYMPRSTIVGVDLSFVFDTEHHRHPNTILIAADATKPEFLSKLGDLKFDVVIDDASHQCADQCATFNLLKDRMNPGGLYIIEDILSFDGCVPELIKLHSPVQVYDLRAQKGRFDDCLVVFKF